MALVGASPRAASFGQRMLEEAVKSSCAPRIYPVNPKYAELAGLRCYPSLADLPEPVDLALLAVPDGALETQLTLAAQTGAKSAVIFGSAFDAQPAGQRPSLRSRLAEIANAAGMAVCGAGCMGLVNVSYGLRAIGYTEADPLPAGPVALVTHSGSVFSALLRARRGFGFTIAVSSGQELVTTAPAYLDYALSLPETKVLALVLEAMRDTARLRQVLSAAADRDLPVVLLATGQSASGRAMVAAHSGALAAADGGWEALARAHGVHRVADLAEFTDTIELFAMGRRAAAAARPGTGIATVHDSGLERAHTADLADELGVPFAAIGEQTTARLAGLLDPGLEPANPLDVWGTGADTRELFGGSLVALADDPAVAAVALAIDLVHELDGDQSYPLALVDAMQHTDKPVAVLSNLGSAIDLEVASQLRASGIAVLEGTRSGLLALGHLVNHTDRRPAWPPAHGRPRSSGAAAVPASGAPLFALLAEYGIAVPGTAQVGSAAEAVRAAEAIGYPVVLKTDEPAILHKSEARGVLLGVHDAAAVRAGYADLATRLGPRVLVCEAVPAGIELALGIARDPELGPLIVVGAGGILVELIGDRAVALPPVGPELAGELVGELKVAKLLAGVRGAKPADLDAVIAAITGLSALATDLGDQLEALDVNPLICTPTGAIAVDALAIPRTAS